MGGGGARAAYQVGVLASLARRYPDLEIAIHTGVSAGAINSAFLANGNGGFAENVENLGRLWHKIDTDAVFDGNAGALLVNALRWGTRLVSGGSKLAPPTRGMVDTSPLRALLQRAFQTPDGKLPGIARNLASGRLRAVGLPATDYATGRTIVYVQGREPEPWNRPNRISVATELTVDHVMASAALPLFFPAVRIGERWLGDGGIRLISPLAPALHLGAERIIAISTRYSKTREEESVPDVARLPAAGASDGRADERDLPRRHGPGRLQHGAHQRPPAPHDGGAARRPARGRAHDPAPVASTSASWPPSTSRACRSRSAS